MSSREIIDLVDDSDGDDNDNVDSKENRKVVYDSDQESVKSQVSFQSKTSVTSNRSNTSVSTNTSANLYSQSAVTSNTVGRPIRRKAKSSSSSSCSSGSSKTMETELKRQMSGKYKNDEIGIVLSISFQSTLYECELVKVSTSNDLNFTGIFYVDSFTHHLIRYTYRPKLLGGRGNIGDINVVTLPFAVIVYPVTEFIRLADLNMNGNHSGISAQHITFPELAKNMNQIAEVSFNLDGCPRDSRLIFLLIDLDTQVLAYRKSKQDTKTGLFNVDDVIAYLLHDRQIEIFQAKTLPHACEYIYSWTKILSLNIYKAEVSEFEVKTKVSKLRAEDDATEAQKEKLMLQETWISMLEMIPYISRQKVRTFIREGRYTCPMDLLHTYSNPSISKECKQALVQNSFSKSTEMKLSKALYNIFVQLDPTTGITD